MSALSEDARILRSLRFAPMPPAQLAAAVGLSEEQISKRIAGLRAAGYEIEDNAFSGYRLVFTPDRLIADDIASRIGETLSLTREILVFEKTGSTNDIAGRFGWNGADEGVVIFAETQTAGRGRLGRQWESAPGEGLWCSILLRPALPLHAWPRLPTWIAVALARAIEDVVSCRPMIKWPNDIFIGGKKIAGILIESHPDEGNRFAVAGIGVNVNQTHFPEPLDGKAGSLRQIAGDPVDRQQLAAALLSRLDSSYRDLSDMAFPALLAEAEERSFLKGRWVEVQAGDGRVLAGVAETLDAQGALQIRERSGVLTTISSGEVTVLSSQPFQHF